jgi:hypothetical protein
VVTWIAWGAVALGVVLVVVAAARLADPMHRLRRATRKLRLRAEELQRLRGRAEATRKRLVEFQAQLAGLLSP